MPSDLKQNKKYGGQGWRIVAVTVHETASSTCVLNALAVPGRNAHRRPDIIVLNKDNSDPQLYAVFDQIVENSVKACGFRGSDKHLWQQITKPTPKV
jgi:hypothetical protein